MRSPTVVKTQNVVRWSVGACARFQILIRIHIRMPDRGFAWWPEHHIPPSTATHLPRSAGLVQYLCLSRGRNQRLHHASNLSA